MLEGMLSLGTCHAVYGLPICWDVPNAYGRPSFTGTCQMLYGLLLLLGHAASLPLLGYAKAAFSD